MKWEPVYMVRRASADIPQTHDHDTFPEYFVSLGLPDDEASVLHLQYYSQYGLAIRGLVRHHQIGQCPACGPRNTQLRRRQQTLLTLIVNATGLCRSKSYCNRTRDYASYFKTLTGPRHEFGGLLMLIIP